MKKNLVELHKKSVKDLEKEAKSLREEIAKIRLELKTKPPKDSNLLIKKRKMLARVLTILQEKKEEQEINKLKN